MKTYLINGHVIDPSTQRDGIYDICIEDGKIGAVAEDLKDRIAEGDQVLDVQGRVVAPGFIDIHMHEDPVKDGHIEYSIFENMLRMGVTTAVGGNCGSTCMDPVAYLDIVDRDKAPCNIAMLAGEITSREKAGCSNKYMPATREQIELIRKETFRCLEGGCVGVSYGTRYAPGSEEEELYAAAQSCKAYGRPIAAHVRDDAEAIFSAIDEMAQIGKAYGIPVEISHIGSMGGFGQMDRVIAQIHEYQREGLKIAMDCYPYEAFSTEIGATTYDDGWLERYQCDYSVLEFSEGKYKGQRANEESFRYYREQDPGALTVCHVMKHEEVVKALESDVCCVGSDGILDHGQGHPRAAGSFPRFFDVYVRNGSISLYEGVRKTSCMAAERLGFKQKGSLAVGKDADIVVFDPETITDRATFEEPMLPPEGIDYVLIAGEVCMEFGRMHKKYLGKSVRV